MKNQILAVFAVAGIAFVPSGAQAYENCLGSERITEFQSMSDGSVVLTSDNGAQYKVTFSKRPSNMAITTEIKTRSAGPCLAEGDEVVMSGVGLHRAKYKVASVASVGIGSRTTAAKSN